MAKTAGKRQFEITQMNPSEIKAWDGNPRLHNIEALKKSIEAFGFRSVVVVNRATGQCEAGHGRVQAAMELGIESIPVMLVDDDARTAAAFAVGDNRQSELSWWDEDMLADILRELQGDLDEVLGAIGYTDYELQAMLATIDPEHDAGVGLERHPQDIIDVFRNATVKQLTLIFEAEEFDKFVASLDHIRSIEGLSSHQEVVTELVRRYISKTGYVNEVRGNNVEAHGNAH
jgi:ParB-like chromosome segregation protein Spo0J